MTLAAQSLGKFCFSLSFELFPPRMNPTTRGKHMEERLRSTENDLRVFPKPRIDSVDHTSHLRGARIFFFFSKT